MTRSLFPPPPQSDESTNQRIDTTSKGFDHTCDGRGFQFFWSSRKGPTCRDVSVLTIIARVATITTPFQLIKTSLSAERRRRRRRPGLTARPYMSVAVAITIR
jgi:hypothetical protein